MQEQAKKFFPERPDETAMTPEMRNFYAKVSILFFPCLSDVLLAYLSNFPFL